MRITRSDRRLHLIIGDANMWNMPTALKVGTTRPVLDLICARRCLRWNWSIPWLQSSRCLAMPISTPRSGFKDEDGHSLPWTFKSVTAKRRDGHSLVRMKSQGLGAE